MKIRDELEPFKYEMKTPVTVRRISKPNQTLDGGVEYEGEWSEAGKRDGRGV